MLCWWRPAYFYYAVSADNVTARRLDDSLRDVAACTVLDSQGHCPAIDSRPFDDGGDVSKASVPPGCIASHQTRRGQSFDRCVHEPAMKLVLAIIVDRRDLERVRERSDHMPTIAGQQFLTSTGLQERLTTHPTKRLMWGHNSSPESPGSHIEPAGNDEGVHACGMHGCWRLRGGETPTVAHARH